MISNQPDLPSLDDLIAAAPDAPCADVVPFTQVVPAMSSLDIARLTEKNHRDVLRDIRTTLEQAGIDQRKFASIYKDSYGRQQMCFLLPRRECDLVISGYSVKYRLAIIDRWHELEMKHSPQTDIDAALNDTGTLQRLLLNNVEKVLALQAAVTDLTPKAEALDRIAEADGLMNITNAAKALQVQPKKLFSYLMQQGWVYRRNGREEYVPYQHRIESGHMMAKVYTITNHTTGDQIIKERALITAKGLALLAKKFSGRAA